MLLEVLHGVVEVVVLTAFMAAMALMGVFFLWLIKGRKMPYWEMVKAYDNRLELIAYIASIVVVLVFFLMIGTSWQ